MIEVLTIVKETDKKGTTSYSVNGNLPIDEAAKALVIVAFNANKPEKEEKKSDVVKGDPP
ncbi:MAG: hypothetical protein WC455_23570 [Dehalococcoidia bacterium]|jgi:hypothetical protein